MTLSIKRNIIAILGLLFLASLLLVQYMEVARKQEEAGLRKAHVMVPESSRTCVECHANISPGIIEHWNDSTHAVTGVGCIECHQAEPEDADGFTHYGALIATIVTPMDCARCHEVEATEFAASHHAAAGNILASLDNFLAETVEGSRVPFNPHAPTLGRPDFEGTVNGMASVSSGCKQCHGAKVGLQAEDGKTITVDDLQPDEYGKPTNIALIATILKDKDGKPLFDHNTWPNTGIGRINLDGSLGSCAACHSRHDFSPRRARQPENCGKCHMGPDHPQKEVYEESKHGVAYRDLKDDMNLDSKDWVLGVDYSAAPTCATCHMSGNIQNGGRVTHDPGERISWTNRPPVSTVMDTDAQHRVVMESDPALRQSQITDTWQQKRGRMQQVCASCHTSGYIQNFYQQYDDFVQNYNEKFAKPGSAIMVALTENQIITKTQFDEELEWSWYYLWHHEGRRARHGASMMAPDYAHWHGMYEVAERWYMEFIPQVREAIEHARATNPAGASAASAVVEEIMQRPEHQWVGKERPYTVSGAEGTPTNDSTPFAGYDRTH